MVSIATLIIREGHRQVKTEIRGDARHDLTLDLRPTGVVSFDGVIPIGATQTAVKPATINVMPCQALRFTTATLISKLSYSRVLVLYLVRHIAASLMLSGRQPMFFRGHFIAPLDKDSSSKRDVLLLALSQDTKQKQYD